MSESKIKKKKGQYPYKKDTGIVRLPSGHPIREEVRDNLNKFDPAAAPKEKAPSIESSIFNADDRTTKELQELKWSGLRRNYISKQLEIWITGNIVKRLAIFDVDRDPGILATAFEEIFGTTGHLIETDATIPSPERLIYKNPH